MTLDLDKIKERLAIASGQKKSGDGATIFWKIKEGESVIRIVPTKDGDPFREFFQHYSVGKNLPFLCPKRQFGEHCSVCEFVSKLFKSQNPEDLALAKKIMVKSRYFSPVLVRGEEDKKVRWWSYSKTTYVKLLKLINKVDEYGDITDPMKGTDLVLSYSTPKGASYPLTDFEPRRKESALCKDVTEEQCEELLNTIPNIETGLNKKTPVEIKKMLDEWIMEGEEEGGEDIHKDVEKFGVKKEESGSDIDAAFKELMG